MMRRIFELCIHLKTQLFCYGYGYRSHVYGENDDRKRNFSKRCLTVFVWTEKNETFRKR